MQKDLLRIFQKRLNIVKNINNMRVSKEEQEWIDLVGDDRWFALSLIKRQFLISTAGIFDLGEKPFHLSTQNILAKVEAIVSDDFCYELESDQIVGYDKSLRRLTEREKIMAKKIGQIYRLVHSSNPNNSCYDSHKNWRKEFE